MSKRPWILVTGASGFLGARLVKQLVARGESVKGFVRAGSSLRMLEGLDPERFQLAYGDALVGHTVYRAMAGCSEAYHVASNYAFWAANPDAIIAPAVEGTRCVLQAATQRGLRRVVVTSSAGILGANDRPQSSDEMREPQSKDAETYFAAKILAREVVARFVDEGLDVVSVLPSAIHGPGDWKPTPSGRLVVNYLRSNPSFRLPVPNGGFNVVDVDDVATGHIQAMERGRSGESYILGGDNVIFEEFISVLSELTGLSQSGYRVGRGTVTLVGALLELWARTTGDPPIITRRVARDFVGRFLWVTSTKAERELGYKHRPIRETLERSVRWYLRNGYLTNLQARRIWLELRAAS